jgi:hypothetical protein
MKQKESEYWPEHGMREKDAEACDTGASKKI